jgi:hypothetical protein
MPVDACVALVALYLTHSRTHRERKEMYIKALEHEVLRLKELYGSSVSDRDAVINENKRLRELLMAHGVSLDSLQSLPPMRGMPASYNGSSSGSISGSYRQESSTGDFSPPPLRSQDSKPMASAGQLPGQHLDYDQIGIDFVLTYDSQGQPYNRAAYPSPPPNQ